MLSKKTVAALNDLLDKYGLITTWKGLLATLIKGSNEHFQYILQRDFLRNTNGEEYPNLLSGLEIGELSVLYEYSLAYVNRGSRKSQGQYFTPDDVAKFMACHFSQFPKGIWVDPCSGVGNLSYWLTMQVDEKDREKFLQDSLIFIDLDIIALEIARILFTLRFQKKVKNLYDEIKRNFYVLNFLYGKLPEFDYAILNPPYVSNVINHSFITHKTKNTYAYFLEVVSRTANGFIAITPQAFTHAKSFEDLRSLLIEKYQEIKIYCFDNVPDNIFKGFKYGSENSNTANSTRAAITIAMKTKKELGGNWITPLLRWKTKERRMMFQTAPGLLTKVTFTKNLFPKLSSDLVSFFVEVQSAQKLSSLLAKDKTIYKLLVPCTPRYFISAVKRDLSRSSMRTLYFSTLHDLHVAYLHINSSLMYWWWRVHDGGMTLSEKTLHSLPLTTVTTDDNLIHDLEMSETQNLVSKLNAGKINQNVKHDSQLITRLNNFIAPNYAKELIKTHNNTNI